MKDKRESIVVLEECIELQAKKSQDYQNPNSNIVQSMHYRRGISSIHDMIHQKLLRAQSLLEPIENGEEYNPNFESLEDTYKDLINYASFAVSYLRGQMEGQDTNRDILNRKAVTTKKAIDPVTEVYVSEVKGSTLKPFKDHEHYFDRLGFPSSDPIIKSYKEKNGITDTGIKDVGDRIDDDLNEASQLKL